jgi:hypothetical protein
MVYFREVQRFRQVWLWVLLVASIVLVGLAMREGAVPIGHIPVAAVLVLAVPVWFWALRLTTEVHDDALHLHFFPMWKKRIIPFNQIRSAQARCYRPIVEYGGWGIRWGLSGQAYNVSGDRGVQLELANGKRLLIGSQRPEELEAAIRSRLLH